MVTNRLFITLAMLMILFSVSFSANAQEDDLPSWCPLEVPSDIPTAIESPVSFEDDSLIFHTDMDEAIVLDESGMVESYALSADESQIALVRVDEDHHSELWVMNTDGTDERELLIADDIAALRTDSDEQLVTGIGQLEWLAADRLVFNSQLTNIGDGLFIFVADDLWSLNTASAELTALLAQGEGGEFLVSPDGGWITVITSDSLSFITPDGGVQREDVLPAYTAIGFGEYYVYPPAYWVADSSALLVAVSSSDDPYSQHEGMVTVWSVPADGSEPSEISTFRAFYASFYISPDLQFVGFWNTDSGNSDTRNIVIARLDGSEEYTLLTGDLLLFDEWTAEFGHFIFTDESQTRMVGDICGQQEALSESN